jgi:hypothetical protein
MKQITILLIAMLLGIFLVGCEYSEITTSNKQTFLDKPPILKVLSQDKNINASTGTYSWTTDNNDGTKTTIFADSASPPEVVKESTPLTVSSKSVLTLSFNDKPSNIKVNIWKNNNSINQEISDNKIEVPETKGAMVYEVVATWNQGTVRYAFLVNVN